MRDGRFTERGVRDARNRLFGYQNMLACDGSMLSASLGVNPSLTITALTEHAMSHIPAKGHHEADPFRVPEVAAAVA